MALVYRHVNKEKPNNSSLYCQANFSCQKEKIKDSIYELMSWVLPRLLELLISWFPEVEVRGISAKK